MQSQQPLLEAFLHSASTIIDTLNNSICLIDFTCSTHMTFDPDEFSMKSPSHSIPKIHTAKGHLHMSYVSFISTPHLQDIFFKGPLHILF